MTSFTINETPQELSRLALDAIQQEPLNWNQRTWHGQTQCGTCHCWAGWIETYLIRVYPDILSSHYAKETIHGREALKLRIRAILGLSSNNFEAISSANNSFRTLVSLHNRFFDDNYYATVDVDAIAS